MKNWVFLWKGKKRDFKWILLMMLFVSSGVRAQGGRSAVIKGNIKDADQKPLEFVTIALKNTSFVTTSDHEGHFFLRVLPGQYTLCAQMLGYASVEIEVEVKAQEYKYIPISLNQGAIVLNHVEVIGQSAVQQINHSAYNVEAIDAKKMYNSTLDIAHALKAVSGVRIKEVGGVGSETQVSLNGFSGRHVRIFMDGIPLDGAGSSLQLNKIPINFADHIEVYKGVVPVELGSDALGGAINIVSKKSMHNFVDASYAYGSFNTHQSNLNIGHRFDNGYDFQITAFQNYSDNNYRVKTKLLDLETNTYSKDDQWFKRFHDNYHNETVIGRIGLKEKPWATRLTLETTLSQEKADIQNANLMKIVFGGRSKEAQSIIPALYYEKKDFFLAGLNTSITAKYNLVHSNNTDTMARQYNWNGDYRTKTLVGESQYSLSEYKSYSGYYSGNVNYRWGDHHFVSLNNIYSTFNRKATDAVANVENSTEATYMKRTNHKNIMGLSYRIGADKWNASAFAKYYLVKVTGPVDVSSTSSASYEEKKKDFNALGYGATATKQFASDFQIKSSYELSFRLPTENELFGDEVLEVGDASLKPEHSNNLNLNLGYSTEVGKHSFYLDAGFIYRLTEDYIRRLIEQKYGGAYYTNHGKVLTLGIDMEARYFYNKKVSAGISTTYQDIRNKERYSATGQELIYYNDRMPNVPYLFSNADFSYQFNRVAGNNNQLILGYNMQYVYQFYRNWASEGGDIIIPSQLSHDLSLTYSLYNGRYNIAFEARNISNELLYDNYSLQKPGRSFYLKLRYYFAQ